MTDPLTTLFHLNDVTQGLDTIQDWIDHARSAAPANQVVQLELDRKQAEIDTKRKLVKMLMIDIASRN